MKKQFFINIDGDKLPFLSVDLNSDGSLVDPATEGTDYALSNRPTVVNITNLGYFPAKGSLWDGESFTHPNGEEHRPACGACENGCETIAYLIDNIYYGGTGLCVGVATNDMLIAALSSSPTITFELFEE